MKLTAWALTVFAVVLVCKEQARGDDIYTVIYTQKGEYYSNPSVSDKYIYPGDYTVKLLIGSDNLGCTLPVGTKSSNTNLLSISGPLAVRMIADPLEYFDGIISETIIRQFAGTVRDSPYSPYRKNKCVTAGTIRVSTPPTVAVPVMVTLTYGPSLTKTYPFVVTQKVGIKSVTASPVRSYYSYMQRVGMTLTPTRKTASREADPTVYFRVLGGKLCNVTSRSDDNYGTPQTVGDGWSYMGSGRDFFEEGKPLTKFADLCYRGRTIVEFGFPDEKMPGQERMMTDSRIIRLEFRVPTVSSPIERSQIRSRGIDTLPPPIIPDPIPPALPNFELQGEKP